MRVMHYGDSKSARPACGSGMIGGRSPKQSADWSRVTCKRCIERRDTQLAQLGDKLAAIVLPPRGQP
jgi:hypothetical protein